MKYLFYAILLAALTGGTAGCSCCYVKENPVPPPDPVKEKEKESVRAVFDLAIGAIHTGDMLTFYKTLSSKTRALLTYEELIDSYKAEGELWKANFKDFKIVNPVGLDRNPSTGEYVIATLRILYPDGVFEDINFIKENGEWKFDYHIRH